MTSNEVNDPKVWYELGEGGGPEEAQNRIQALVDDYGKSRENVETWGSTRTCSTLSQKR
jgi:hypothetical protein